MPTAEIPPRVASALDAVGFPYGLERSTDALSGGEQQLLALAGTLALEPGLLLLDEPTANLDGAAADRLRDAVARAVEGRRASLVVVEHRVDDWIDLVDRVVVLAGARGVVLDGSPQSVFDADPSSLAAAGVWSPGFSPDHEPAPAESRGPAVIRAEGLTFRYPGAALDALGAVDVELHGGEALAVVGPTGSGKSSLALLLGGLLLPTSGSLRATTALTGGASLSERPLARWPARALVRHVGSVFQDPEHQFLAANVRDELLIGPRRAGLGEAEASARADELLARLHLEHLAEANPFTLSGGEKRRLSVATALATRPRVLVADEPTFGQDPVGWTELLSLFAGLRREGHAICFASHDERFVAALADRTLALEGGGSG